MTLTVKLSNTSSAGQTCLTVRKNYNRAELLKDATDYTHRRVKSKSGISGDVCTPSTPPLPRLRAHDNVPEHDTTGFIRRKINHKSI